MGRLAETGKEWEFILKFSQVSLCGVSTTNRHLPWVLAISFCKDWIMCCFSCWPSTPPEWVQGGEQKWGILCSGKPAGQVFRELDIFRSWFYEPFLVSPPILKSTKILPGDNCRSFTGPAKTFYKKKKKNVSDCRYSPFTKITYIRSFPPASLEQFLRAVWGAVSWAAVLIWPQIKFNPQLSCWASFSVNRCLVKEGRLYFVSSFPNSG